MIFLLRITFLLILYINKYILFALGKNQIREMKCLNGLIFENEFKMLECNNSFLWFIKSSVSLRASIVNTFKNSCVYIVTLVR